MCLLLAASALLAAPQDVVVAAEDDDENTAQAFKRARSQDDAAQSSNEQLRLEHEYNADYENFLDMPFNGPDDADDENLPLSQLAAATFPGASPDVVRCSREPGTPPLSQPAAVTFPGASPDVVHCSRLPATPPAAAAAVLDDDDAPLVQPVAAAFSHPLKLLVVT